VKGLFRLGGTFLIVGAGLLTIVDAEAAVRARDVFLLAFAVPIVVLWLGAGSLMVGSLVSEAFWDEKALYLAFAFKTRAVDWNDVLRVRVLTPEGWPTRRAAALVLLSYRHRVKGKQARSWALLALRQNRAVSRDPEGDVSGTSTVPRTPEGVTMIHGREQAAGDATQLAYEGNVAQAAARLVAMARAFRVRENREEPLTDELRAAQTDLMRTILLACGAGLTIDHVQFRLSSISNRPGVTEGAATLLRETMRSVREHLR
jgi:hypothetical protein